MPCLPRSLLNIVLFALLISTSALAQDDVVLDRISAVVNEGVVLESEIERETAFIRDQAESNRQSLPDDEALRSRVLDLLIDQEIRRQHAQRLGIAIDASSVNRAIEQVARSNNMDTLRFRQTLQQQGFDYDQFRRNIEQELLLQRLIQRDVESRIRVSSQEIDDFVDNVSNDAAEQLRYRLQHILVAVPSSAPEAEFTIASQNAEAIVAQLEGGEDFSAVAAASSDGSRALQGGDLGWRTLQELPDYLVEAVRRLEVGKISPPTRSSNGLHIVKLNERQSGDLSQQKETLARHIFIAGNDPAIEQRLRQALQQIRGGEAFSAVAEQISEDPNSAPNGGELPWFRSGDLPQEMERAADGLKPNVISEPFRTQFGWHLLEVLDRRTRTVDDAAQRQQAQATLSERKIEQETERWIRQLRDESFIDVRS